MTDTPVPAAPASPISGKTLLIVEDDTLLHNLLAGKLATLREQGVNVFPTFDAAQAMKVVSEHKPDLILLDIMLPNMTGFEFLEKMHAENPTAVKAPVIIFSNLNADTDKNRAKDLGVTDFIVKANSSLDEITNLITKRLSGDLS